MTWENFWSFLEQQKEVNKDMIPVDTVDLTQTTVCKNQLFAFVSFLMFSTPSTRRDRVRW